MTKAELIDIVAEKCEGVTKSDIARVYDAVFETMSRSLEVDKRYAVAGFGSFEVKHRPQREGRNPMTKEAITIAAKNAVLFKPSTALKDRLNK